MRVRAGKARHRSKKRLFKEARGNFLGRRKLLRSMKETVLRARAFAFIHRRLKKREYRALWITRLSAACRARGMSYSNFIRGLTIAGVGLNRKTLSELAIHEPAIFDEIVEVAKNSIPEPSPQPQPA
ncbi:MAG TPA: 50S ribosomal protein L20 [Planctomycetaceae bacterium]|jgi:large subunit ribosomal protein L20|nr:50S ribosomal protein L20 [Planctomycetaceae bacterium]